MYRNIISSLIKDNYMAQYSDDEVEPKKEVPRDLMDDYGDEDDMDEGTD